MRAAAAAQDGKNHDYGRFIHENPRIGPGNDAAQEFLAPVGPALLQSSACRNRFSIRMRDSAKESILDIAQQAANSSSARQGLGPAHDFG